jgi:hypothetical protein
LIDGRVQEMLGASKVSHLSFVGAGSRLAYRYHPIEGSRRWKLKIGKDTVGDCPAACYLDDGTCAYYVIKRDGSRSCITSKQTIPCSYTLSLENIKICDLMSADGTRFFCRVMDRKKNAYGVLFAPDCHVPVSTATASDINFLFSSDGKRLLSSCVGKCFIDNVNCSTTLPPGKWSLPEDRRAAFSPDSRHVHFTLRQGSGKAAKLISWMDGKWSEPYDELLSPPFFVDGKMFLYVFRDSKIHRLESPAR